MFTLCLSSMCSCTAEWQWSIANSSQNTIRNHHDTALMGAVNLSLCLWASGAGGSSNTHDSPPSVLHHVSWTNHPYYEVDMFLVGDSSIQFTRLFLQCLLFLSLASGNERPGTNSSAKLIWIRCKGSILSEASGLKASTNMSRQRAQGCLLISESFR